MIVLFLKLNPEGHLTYSRTSISLICTSEGNFMGPQQVNIECYATYPITYSAYF